jgi:hypothetical protein
LSALMKQQFAKLSIVMLTLISMTLSVIIILVLGISSISQSFSTLEATQLSNLTTKLMSRLDDVAHNFAVERGLSAGFLGAPDEARRNKVKQQRDKAEEAVSSLELLIASEQKYLDLGFVEKLSLLQTKLKQRKSIRDQVDRIQGQNAFLYYSQVNRLAIDAMELIRSYNSFQDQQAGITIAINLSWLKERAGQTRGKINGILAKNNLSISNKGEVGLYIEEMNAKEQTLSVLLPEASLTEFKKRH